MEEWRNTSWYLHTLVISRNEVTAPNGNQPQIQDEAKKKCLIQKNTFYELAFVISLKSGKIKSYEH